VPVTVFEPGSSELELMHYNAFDLTHRDEIARRAYAAASAYLRKESVTVASSA
jgi:hypothetical protein